VQGPFHAVKVTDNVYWVGAIDWSIREFHGYSTGRGTTYNAFLVLAEKVTLIDTVKAGFGDEMLSRIASVIDPSQIDVIISNHAEPDHTGELARTIECVKPSAVYASKNGCRALHDHYGLGEKLTPVQEGQTLDLGGASLTFLETKMCHWPDSMVSYLAEDKLLFSQDGFGMHLASHERFDDEIDPALLRYEAAKYYANILMPLGRFVQKTLDKIRNVGVPLEIIAPDHGPLWRSKPSLPLDWYAEWSAPTRSDKAVVLYDTMWHHTEQLARAIGEGLGDGGARPTLLPLSGTDRSELATRLLEAGALIVGSPTMNKQLFPTLADALTYLKGLAPTGLIGAAFGSHGWSGEGAKLAEAALRDMNVEILAPPTAARYQPTPQGLQDAYDLGVSIAKELRQRYPRT